MKRNEDRLLFKQIKKGNKSAFDTLFRKYYAALVKFGMAYVHNGQISEEIVQDCFIKIWENAPRIDIESSLKAYLYRSVRNGLLNYLAHIQTQQKHELEHSKLNAPMECKPEEGVADFLLFQTLLAKATGELPEKCREIFEMAKFEGLTYEEISQYLQVSVKTIENQMGIALRKLRQSLAPFKKQIYG